jgi:hypothetical protein
MRATVKNYRGGGAPTVNVGGEDIGTSFATLVAPPSNGDGAGVDVSALPSFKSIQVTGAFRGSLNIEISNDGGASYALLTAFQPNQGGIRTVDVDADFLRVTRSGIVSDQPGLPVITIGATSNGGGGGGGGTITGSGTAGVIAIWVDTTELGDSPVSVAGGEVVVDLNLRVTGDAAVDGSANVQGNLNVNGTAVIGTAVIGNVFAGAIGVTGDADVDGSLSVGGMATFAGPIARATPISPPALAAGTTNDYNPAGFTTCNVVRIATNAANSALGGLVVPPAAPDGSEWVFVNLGPGTLTLIHDEGTEATAARRFAVEGGIDRVLGINGNVIVRRDATTARWYVLG